MNNRQLQAVMLQYKRDCESAETTGKRKPQLPNYFAQSVMKIAERLARKPQFALYSYLDEMIGDAILACVKYASSYNPDKYENPFAYFTQVIYHSFISRLNDEQKHRYTKALIIKNSGVVEEDENFTLDSVNGVIAAFENKMAKRKQKESDRQKAKAERDALEKQEAEEASLYEEAHSKNRLHTNFDMFEGK